MSTEPKNLTRLYQLGDLMEAAERCGFTEHQVLLAAQHHCKVQALDELDAGQIGVLMQRMEDRQQGRAEASGLLHFTPAEMAAELGREVGLRRNVYPRLIKQGKLAQDDAERQIALMNAAYYSMKALAELGSGWSVPVVPLKES